jgi:5-(carboxyamino)imidazole ribonucleotide mutase
MGSDSDLPIMAKAADILAQMGIEYEMRIISAHRAPDVIFEYARGAEGRGIKVLIAGAGMAAHLPGVCAALFKLPVIGVPILSNALDGEDALYAIVQMPPGIPVATVAINGALNAGLLAAQILATADGAVRARLQEYTDNMLKTIKDKDARLQEVGYKEY